MLFQLLSARRERRTRHAHTVLLCYVNFMLCYNPRFRVVRVNIAVVLQRWEREQITRRASVSYVSHLKTVFSPEYNLLSYMERQMTTTSRAGHDHITTILLQLGASRLTAVHTQPTAECYSAGYIRCWQAGTRLTVPWATALPTSTSTGAVQIVHSDERHPQQTMSSVPRWRCAARRNGVNANRSGGPGTPDIFKPRTPGF